ncbi:hypothetical protein I3760_09G165600 [Carya illinoinensis]|nr:hypothetical protein I3760_09G165600 [Carya illinoinensis]
MKILTWNCRDIGRPRAIRNLKANIRTHNPDAIFLFGTLLHDVNIAAVVNRLGFSPFVYNPPIGKWGGLLFMPFATSSSPNDLALYITQQGLVDLGHKGPTYTWTNNIQGQNNIRERLDRGISNLQWNNLFLDANVKTLPRISSYHSPILLDTSNCHQGKKSSKFEEFWIRDHSSFEVVQTAWLTHVVGTLTYILTRKLKATKHALKNWNINSFGHIQNTIKNLTFKLNDLQNALPTHDSIILEENIKENLNEQLRREESLWRQKSRNTWLTTTDLNTKYFHNSTTIRRRKNNINFLKTEIDNGPQTPLKSRKSLFYKYYWSIIKNDLQDAIKSFFTHGKILKEINHTNIALVPKMDNPTIVHHFRPISLSNVCYKIIAKILANRLKTKRLLFLVGSFKKIPFLLKKSSIS